MSEETAIKKRRRRRRKSRRSSELLHQTSTTTEAPKQDESSAQLVYLTANNPLFPILWPQFCARVRKLWDRHAPYMPARPILDDWFRKLHDRDSRLSLVHIGLIVEDGVHIAAHWIATANFYYGECFIEIGQLQVDRMEISRQFKKQGVQGLIDWIENNNKILEEAESPSRFKAIRFLTPHNPKFWQRWLGSALDFELVEHTLTFSLKEANDE